MSLDLWTLMESWLMAVDHAGRQARSWSYIQGSTCDHENKGKTNNLGWMLYSVDAVLGGCCTRWMLYSVDAVLGGCCTRWMLDSVDAVLGGCCTRWMPYSVDAVLGVNYWSWHGEMQWDDLTLCSCDDGRVVDKKERWRMRIGAIWRIRANMRNQGYHMPERV